MVQDVLKGDKEIVATTDTSQLEGRLMAIENSISTLDQTVKNLQLIANVAGEDEEDIVGTVGDTGMEREETPHPAQRISLSQLLGGINVTEMHEDLTSLQKEVANIRGDLNMLQKQMEAALPGNFSRLYTVYVEWFISFNYQVVL